MGCSSAASVVDDSISEGIVFILVVFSLRLVVDHYVVLVASLLLLSFLLSIACLLAFLLATVKLRIFRFVSKELVHLNYWF